MQRYFGTHTDLVFVFCFDSFIYNPLHGARRAMAPALPLGDERNVPTILEFLENTRVGKMPSRILLAGGPDVEEEELEGFSLQV